MCNCGFVDGVYEVINKRVRDVFVKDYGISVGRWVFWVLM